MMRFFLLIHTWIIWALLAAAAVFFGYQTVAVWSRNDGNDRPEVKKTVQKTPQRQAGRSVGHHRSPRYQVYEVIAQKDLFSSDRKEKLPENSSTSAAVKAAQPLDKRFALFGIVINGSEKKALVANLDKKGAPGKAVIWVKVGDKIGSLSVSEIQPVQIILTQGGRTYTIRLSDQSESQRRFGGRKRKKPDEPTTTIIKKQKVKRPADHRSKTSS